MPVWAGVNGRTAKWREMMGEARPGMATPKNTTHNLFRSVMETCGGKGNREGLGFEVLTFEVEGLRIQGMRFCDYKV